MAQRQLVEYRPWICDCQHRERVSDRLSAGMEVESNLLVLKRVRRDLADPPRYLSVPRTSLAANGIGLIALHHRIDSARSLRRRTRHANSVLPR